MVLDVHGGLFHVTPGPLVVISCNKNLGSMLMANETATSTLKNNKQLTRNGTHFEMMVAMVFPPPCLVLNFDAFLWWLWWLPTRVSFQLEWVGLSLSSEYTLGLRCFNWFQVKSSPKQNPTNGRIIFLAGPVHQLREFCWCKFPKIFVLRIPPRFAERRHGWSVEIWSSPSFSRRRPQRSTSVAKFGEVNFPSWLFF